MAYQYDSLPSPRHFRFLKIILYDHPDLHLQQSTHDLDNPPPYEALSYTWGKALRPLRSEQEKLDEPYYPEDLMGTDFLTYTIFVNDKPIEITENLYDALVQLRDNKYPNLIWIDAVCINQSDIEERQSQVAQMGDLYASARKVIIWLGKDETYLEEFKWAHSMLWKWGEKVNGNYRQPRDPNLLTELDISLEEWERRWISYSQFYATRRWFSRAWIVQELALAKETEVLCGKSKLDIDEMWALQALLRSLTTWFHELIENSTKQEASSDFLALCHALMSVKNGGPNAEVYQTYADRRRWLEFFIRMVLLMRTREAGVKHDKVYAAIGMCNRFLPAGVPSPITPNYSLSAPEAFYTVTSTVLSKLPNLDLLSEVEDKSIRVLKELPSWAPDFSLGKGHHNIATFCKHFKCSGGLNSEISVNNRILAARGARIDTITHVSMPMDKKSASPPTKLNIMLGFAQLLGTTYEPTGQDRLEVLWRTLILDSTDNVRVEQGKSNYPAPADEVNKFYDWVMYWYSSILVNIDREGLPEDDPSGRAGYKAFLRQREETFKESTVKLPTFDQIVVEARQRTLAANAKTADISTMPMSDAASHFQFRVQRVLILRRLLRTTNGYFGLGHVSSKVGDEVWMLTGGSVPYVLRPVGDGNYTFVGEAYLHGFMNGETLQLPEFDERLTDVKIM